MTEEIPFAEEVVEGVEAVGAVKRAPPRLSRLIVNETVLFAAPGRGVQEVASRQDASFIRLMERCEEMPYRRELTVGEEWQPIDWGWAGPNPSQVVMCNEERGKEASSVEVGILIETTLGSIYVATDRVRPLQSTRTEPIGEKFVRCVKGQARITLAVTPGEKT